jgi:LAS superfamily LD-carboxypeptidase LdcB
MPLAPARRLAGVLTITALLVASLGGISLAVPSQEKLDDAKQHAKQLESRIEQAEAELREVEKELEELERRLEEMQERLEAAMEVHRQAEAEASAASARARASEEELAAAIDELENNHSLLGGLARDAYKYGAPSTSPAMTTMELMGNDSDDLAERLHYLTRGMDARSDALERSEVLRVQVEVLTARALEEERELRSLEAEAETKRDEAAGLHAQVQDLVSEHSVKLDRSIALVAEIEEEHEKAEQRVGELEVQVQKEREEAERRERERREREERERQERERREREERERKERERKERERAAAAASNRSSSGGGSSSGGSVSVSGSGQLRTVGGITVDASIADNLQRLLNDARADGIVLGGHGYRSPEVTARLRIANGCPDVYESPASACRVPTARPGSSMHEKGLAIDFTYRGQTICYPRPGSRCSGNAAFDWLKANAHKYGLKNLPSEAWHWSTNGR